jgi:hypothetical protein
MRSCFLGHLQSGDPNRTRWPVRMGSFGTPCDGVDVGLVG